MEEKHVLKIAGELKIAAKQVGAVALLLTENATIQIYDMAGRRVRTIDKEASGGDEAVWDVRNSDGNELASGTYVFIIQSAEDTFRGKVIVLR